MPLTIEQAIKQYLDRNRKRYNSRHCELNQRIARFHEEIIEKGPRHRAAIKRRIEAKKIELELKSSVTQREWLAYEIEALEKLLSFFTLEETGVPLENIAY